MPAIKESVEISRTPEEVFSYLTELSHLPEWQASAVAVRPPSGPLSVGERIEIRRRIGRREIDTTMEVTELDPPRSWHLHGIEGPVRADVQGTVEPVGDGTRSLVTLDIDFHGHGLGKVLLPFVVMPSARKEVPESERVLKGLLEQGSKP
ncbi:SRPBCC family protein [Streptomyces sp. NRRL S-87]|uniref:SRPBCC family protein n=1 Tax=Streptomyces sp. NRRL S-87 TaxID=1463920 RepID=UPI0004BF5D43|nr:SRPBCC family protein [Streptomyces sp. NRRL S-87]